MIRKAQRRALVCLLNRPTLRELALAGDGDGHCDSDGNAYHGVGLGLDLGSGGKSSTVLASQNQKQEVYTMQYTIPSGFLAGMIGEIKVPLGHNRHARVLPNHRNPNAPLSAIPDPTRGAPEQLSESDRKKALQLAYAKLIKGKRWTPKTCTVSAWAGSTVQWDADAEEFKLNGVSWDEARRVVLRLPVCRSPLSFISSSDDSMVLDDADDDAKDRKEPAAKEDALIEQALFTRASGIHILAATSPGTLEVPLSIIVQLFAYGSGCID